MNATELRQQSQIELQETLLELLKEQFNLRMQRGTEQLARHHLMRNVRRNIARVRTIMNEKSRVGGV